MKRFRAAVLGLGLIGPQHIDALLRVPEAALVAVCDQDGATLNAQAERLGIRAVRRWQDVVADPEIDVIHNCLPPALHDEVNRAALLAGKHIYCEKPFSTTAEGARRIAALAHEKGLAIGVNHQYRLNAAVQEMRARVQSGDLGKILAVTGCYLQESASRPDDWSRRMENTGEARTVSDIGIHWADTASCVLGQPITEVLADMHIHYPVRTDAAGQAHPITTEDTAFILTRFADGTPGQVMVSKAANGHKNDLQVTVWGEKYSLTWRQEEPDRLIQGEKGMNGARTLYMNAACCRDGARPFVTLPMGHVMGWADALKNAVQAFYASLSDGSWRGATVYAGLDEGIRHAAFVDACVLSSRERRWTEVAP